MSENLAEYDPRIDHEFLEAITPAAEQAVQNHLEKSKMWYPHEYIPYHLSGTLDKNGDRYLPLHRNNMHLPESVRSAFFVNLLTEDNLPYYFGTIQKFTAKAKADVWYDWLTRWTAEEARHSHALRTFIELSGVVDLRYLEDSRMQQMRGAKVPLPRSTADGLAYVPMQELATRIAHQNTVRKLKNSAIQEPEGKHSELQKDVIQAGYNLVTRVATDENFHFILYRDILTAGITYTPDIVLPALCRQIMGFDMPGTGIPDFKAHSDLIAADGIYDLQLFYESILTPLLIKHWKVESLTGLSPESAKAQDDIMKYYNKLGKIVVRMNRLAEAKKLKQPASAE